ncbi:MAG: methionyl-tRNA formyltransferase [Patescibacteria group bacterium]|nr:methionyl-tRNA formyltransferase [Patescibacteria group bacterium]
MQNPKLAFFGTPYVARDTFDILFAKGFVPAVVVTSPDAKKGRGLALQPSEAKSWALAHGIPVLTPEKLDDAVLGEISSFGCDVAIVVAYGKIFPEQFLDAFPRGVLNIHYSLLPKYRGASPVESALLAGDAVTGVSIQKMARELDAGDIVAQTEVPILPEETTQELRPRLITIGAELLAGTLPAFLDGRTVTRPQDASQATFTKKIAKADGLLDLANDPHENWNKYRAYAESPGTYFFLERDGKSVRVKIAAAKYGNGVFTPTRVIPEGKREMNYEDFARSFCVN